MGAEIIKAGGLDTKRKFNRINYLQNKYERMYDKGTYNKNQYKRFVHVVSSNYMMTRDRRNEAKELIDKHDLRTLMRGNPAYTCGWEAIVTAICFYVMRKENRPLPYKGKFIQSTGLNNRIYNRIVKKLKANEVKPCNDITYYLIEKVKSEAK